MPQLRVFAAVSVLAASFLVASCSSGSSSSTPTVIASPVAQPASLRVVNGVAYGVSGPIYGYAKPEPVDVYVYPVGSPRLATPSFTVDYGGVSAYQGFTPGTYQLDVFPKGVSSGSPVLNQSITLTSGQLVSVAVAGERTVSLPTLQLLDFVEPAVPAGQTVVVFHEAAPTQPALTVGIAPPGYIPGYQGPNPPTITSLFSFSLAPASGPASLNSVAGGEYVYAPASLPSSTTFAVNGQGTPPAAAANSFNTPASGHLSIFIIDVYQPQSNLIVTMASAQDP